MQLRGAQLRVKTEIKRATLFLKLLQNISTTDKLYCSHSKVVKIWQSSPKYLC
jgi:hypothetical protein